MIVWRALRQPLAPLLLSEAPEDHRGRGRAPDADLMFPPEALMPLESNLLKVRITPRDEAGESSVAWRRRHMDREEDIEPWIDVPAYQTTEFWTLLTNHGVTMSGNIRYFEAVIRAALAARLELIFRGPNSNLQRDVLLFKGPCAAFLQSDAESFVPVTIYKRSQVWRDIKELIELKPGRDADKVLAWLRSKDSAATFYCQYKLVKQDARGALFAVLSDEKIAFEFKMKFG